MSKKATITTITSTTNNATNVNANDQAINDKLDNTLSLDGSTPNAMQADLDLNNQNIINGGVINADTVKIAGESLVPATKVPDWEGAWATTTAYAVDDLVQENGNTYICVTAHTAGTFATDLSAAYWELFASKGDSGAGSGDVVAANNLSDLADTDTALANLGGGTKGIAIFKDVTSSAIRTEISAQEQNDILDDLSGLTQDTNKVPYFDSATTAETLDLETTLTDSDTSVPTSGAVADFVTRALTEEAAQTTTSGSSYSETGIPSWVTEINVHFDEVSLSGTDNLLLQIGDSGGVETSGYISATSWSGNASSSTSGFIIRVASNDRNSTGVVTLKRALSSSNKWSVMGVVENNGDVTLVGGMKSLSSTLTQLQIVPTGSNTFDNGSFNITYR